VRAALAAALALHLALAAACRDDASRPPVSPVATLADSADQFFLGVRWRLTDAGVSRGTLVADTAFAFAEGSRFEFRNVRVDFNTATGAKNGTMTAKRGRYDVSQGLLEGFGDVVITTVDGKRLESPQLRYQQGMNEISSDSTFRFVNGAQVQEGIGFRADPQLTRVQVLRGASGRAGPIVLPGR
jgi:LPS export ABC transporter protein LptC